MTEQAFGSRVIFDTRPVVEVAEKFADVLVEFGVIGKGATPLHDLSERRGFVHGVIDGADEPSIYHEYTAAFSPVRLFVDYTLNGSEVRIKDVQAVDHPYDNGKIDWDGLNVALTNAL